MIKSKLNLIRKKVWKCYENCLVYVVWAILGSLLPPFYPREAEARGKFFTFKQAYNFWTRFQLLKKFITFEQAYNFWTSL
jgi:hypothetical protein